MELAGVRAVDQDLGEAVEFEVERRNVLKPTGLFGTDVAQTTSPEVARITTPLRWITSGIDRKRRNAARTVRCTASMVNSRMTRV